MHIAELTAYSFVCRSSRDSARVGVRQESTNLVVYCRLDNGITGWGEGVPRHYVTGETPEGALQQFAATEVAGQLQHACGSWPDVIRLCDPSSHRSTDRIRGGLTATHTGAQSSCSLIHAYGRHFGGTVSSVARYFPAARDFIRGPVSVRYSTTITAETVRRERISALKMRLYGFHQCKVKVGVAGADDAQWSRCIRFWLGRRMDIRLDANEAWRAVELPGRLMPLLRSRLSCIEQPLSHEGNLRSWGKPAPSARRTRDAG